MNISYTFTVGDMVKTTVYIPPSFHFGRPDIGGIQIGEIFTVKRIELSEDGWNTVVLESTSRGEVSIDQGLTLETTSFSKL
jgi:hypothetical protein